MPEVVEDVQVSKLVVVTDIRELPYAYIPFSSVTAARIKFPTDTLYVYNGIAPKGYQIVAVPVLMKKPTEDEEEKEND